MELLTSLTTFYLLEQDLRSLFPHLLFWKRNASQGHLKELSIADIIITNHSDIIGYSDASLKQAMDEADRQLIRGQKDGSGSFGQIQEFIRRIHTRIDPNFIGFEDPVLP